ncbi:MAG TPA: hypothetical protein PLQ54_06700 [Armatimonadota bacterium]|nr:hypothetical protein [Armatimonadota bacterium]
MTSTMCSAQVVLPTVVLVTSKVFSPTTGTYAAGQLVTGATQHKAVFNTSQANYLPCRLRLDWEQYPSWAQSDRVSNGHYQYTYTRNAAVTMYSSPNPILKSWYIPPDSGPRSYAFVAATTARPDVCSVQYPPPPPAPPADPDKQYAMGEEVQGDSDVTQINTPAP